MTIVIHHQYRSMTDFIRQLPQLFEHTGITLHDGRNKVKRFQVNGETVVVKKYKRPHFVQRIAYTFFKKSKAERAYLFAGVLRNKGFDTPHEIAYIKQKKGGLLQDSYFVSLNCGYPSLSAPLNKEPFDRRLAGELAAYIVKLHTQGVLHGDLNLSNILYYTDKEDNHQFALIDTNRSLFKQPNKKECLENLKRVTHHKALLRYITLHYATVRGWNSEECVQEVLRYLSQFEKKRRWKRTILSWMGIKKHHHP